MLIIITVNNARSPFFFYSYLFKIHPGYLLRRIVMIPFLVVSACAEHGMRGRADVSAMVHEAEQAYKAALAPRLRTSLGEFTVGRAPFSTIDDVVARRGLLGPNRTNATLMMSFEEALILVDELQARRTRRYLEWGSGGSTELVSWLVVSRQLRHPSAFKAYSVESSAQWIETLRNRSSLIADATMLGGLKFVHGDIGPTGSLGFPKAKLAARRALHFVDNEAALSHRKFDVALVDGRFRVACAYSAALHLAPNGTLLMHDFGPPMMHHRRREYEALLHEGHFVLERLVRSLAVLRLRHRLPLDPAVQEALRARRDHWADESAN